MAGKSKRSAKRSQGVHGGGGKVTLTPLQKALMGKGAVAALAARRAAEDARAKKR